MAARWNRLLLIAITIGACGTAVCIVLLARRDEMIGQHQKSEWPSLPRDENHDIPLAPKDDMIGQHPKNEWLSMLRDDNHDVRLQALREIHNLLGTRAAAE